MHILDTTLLYNNSQTKKIFTIIRHSRISYSHSKTDVPLSKPHCDIYWMDCKTGYDEFPTLYFYIWYLKFIFIDWPKYGLY